MTRRRGGDLGGGFLLGVSLGLVFVPCAGPVLATITALSAQHRIGIDTRRCSRSPTRSAQPGRCC